MHLSFLGACHEVTGSCFYLEAAGKRILIDCGMEQGTDEYENQEIPVAPSELDAVLLTHAHIDHSGRLPMLTAGGYRGPIHATYATCSLCGIMLRDSAHIQEFEAEWRNRKARRSGEKPFVPVYTMQDAENAVKQFEGHFYGEWFELCSGIRVRLHDAGHLLGSASIELTAEEDGKKVSLLFSGDIGNLNQPLMRDPCAPDGADYVVMESTYGDRLHEKPPDYAAQLAQVIQRTFDRGGNVIIPSFAVGRTQEMLYFLRRIKQEGLVHGHDGFPVYVDSPLAVEATGIFRECDEHFFDEEAAALVRSGINPITFEGLHLSVSSSESRAINEDRACKVILSAGGMCEAGRVKHHLKHNLWRPESTVLFVGYQAAGSLGRSLVEGAKKVKLFHENITVKAEILRLPGVSGHADRSGLTGWLDAQKKPRAVFVVHGDEKSCDALSGTLCAKGYRAYAPYPGARFDLLSGCWQSEGVRERLRHAKKDTGENAAYARLLAAGERLMALIRQHKGDAKKDLVRFADQIVALCEKWSKS